MICNIHSINPPTDNDYLCLIFHSVTSSGCWLSRRCSSAVRNQYAANLFCLYSGFDTSEKITRSTQPPKLSFNFELPSPTPQTPLNPFSPVPCSSVRSPNPK